MGQSLSKVYVHIIFSTKNREKLIDENISLRLFEYIGGICKSLECQPIQVGGHENHIHILCILSKKITQMKLVEEIKKRSSKWIKTSSPNYANFYWQNGYAIFSINPTQIKVVKNYIQHQKEHHESKSFKNELRSFLKKYQVEFQEDFIWE